MVDYPRVLVISPDGLSSPVASGVLMRNLFEGWPRESLANIYAMERAEEDFSICAHYYRLCGRVSMHPRQLISRVINFARGDCESLDGIMSIRITGKLQTWLDNFQPQVIYSQMGPLWFMRLTNIIAESYQIPLVVHFMDDYIIDWPVRGIRRRNIFPFAQILHSRAKREFDRGLHNAHVRLCISELMSREYHSRYGGAFHTINNGVDPDQWLVKSIHEPRNDEPFTLLFSGSIRENINLSSLVDIAGAVRSLAGQGMSIKMEIACPATSLMFRSALESSPVVQFCEMVPRSELPRRLTKCDLLLIPYDFGEQSLRFFRLSWPTKLPEYMCTGTPILMLAPKAAVFVEYARQEGIACVVDQPGQVHIEAALRHLATDVDLRRTLGARARAVAVRDMNSQRIRDHFQSLLRT